MSDFLHEDKYSDDYNLNKITDNVSLVCSSDELSHIKDMINIILSSGKRYGSLSREINMLSLSEFREDTEEQHTSRCPVKVGSGGYVVTDLITDMKKG